MLNHEPLLLPALKYASSVPRVRLAEAVEHLVAERSLTRPKIQGSPGRATPPFNLVSWAFISLATAGLVRSVAPAQWELTPEGREVLDQEPESIGFDFLSTFEAYRGHWDDKKLDYLRQSYQLLRFEHYTGGRALFLQGFHDTAAVALAYSIEYHLKAALEEVRGRWEKEDNAFFLNHDLKQQYRRALHHGVLTSTYISFDFLEYVGDHFSRRYPSGEDELLGRRRYWRFGGSILATYDDCVLQLDSGLAEVYESQRYSLGAHALFGHGVSPNGINAFFHNNIFALDRLPGVRSSCEKEDSNLPQEQLENPELLLARTGFPHPGESLARARRVLDCQLAAFFRYPKVGEPDPDPARLLSRHWHQLPSGIHYSRWVIGRIRSEFGDDSVEIVEDKDSEQVCLRVFDRKAKRWVRELKLRQGLAEYFLDTPDNRAQVETWIEETRLQFRKLRPNLRRPRKRVNG